MVVLAKRPSTWADAEKDEDADGEDARVWRLLAKKSRPLRWACLVAPVVAAVALGMGAQALNEADMAAARSTTSLSVLSDPGRDQAWSAAESWLKDSSNLVGASPRIVSWDGSRRIQVGSSASRQWARVHRLTVEAQGRWWRMEVTVLEDSGQQVASPSLTPIPVNADASSSGTASWPDTLSDVDMTPALQAALVNWGKALAGDDPDALRSLMGDPDSSAAYSPLSLGGSESVKVSGAAYLDRGKVDRQNSSSDWAVARVTVGLKSSNGGGQANLDFDVLVENPDAGDPRICAWGAPGTGPGLKEWSNRTSDAVNADLSRAADDADEASPSPSPSSSPSE